MNESEKELVAILEGLDETGNAALGPIVGIPEAGNPHYTMSQRWAYERLAGSRRACWICRILTWSFRVFYLTIKNYDHCAEAIKDFPRNLPSEG